MDFGELLDDLNRVVNASLHTVAIALYAKKTRIRRKRNEQDIKQIRKGKRMGLTVILNLCTLICQLIILATFIRKEE